jgi:hypothetical protein
VGRGSDLLLHRSADGGDLLMRCTLPGREGGEVEAAGEEDGSGGGGRLLHLDGEKQKQKKRK